MSTQRRPVVTVIRDAAGMAALAAALAFAVNATRRNGLPVVAERPYEVLVPCPEPSGAVDAIDPAQAHADAQGALWVDARGAAEHAAWHLPGAVSVPFDFLEPVADPTVKRIVGAGARRVFVYGDGASPDAGQQLARELAARGVRQVAWIRGGAPRLRELLAGRVP